MAASLFCEHKKLRSVCFLCGASRASPPPAKGPVAHDVDDTWHALRLEALSRMRRFLALSEGDAWSADAYYGVYDRPPRRGKVHSEEEDPGTFGGAFYLATVKMFDITIDERRIQGYNGLRDWDEMRDYVFRQHAPGELPEIMRTKRLLFHGGQCGWPRLQISSELVRSPRLREAVRIVVFGTDGRTPDLIDDDAMLARLTALDALAREESITIGTIPFASRLIHAFAPERWPAAGARSGPDVGAHLDIALPAADSPAGYLAFAAAVRAYAKQEGHEDLARTDIAFSNAFEEMQAGDDDELDPADLDA